MDTPENKELFCEGVLNVDIFNITIPVFLCPRMLVDAFKDKNIAVDEDWADDSIPTNGLAIYTRDSEGCAVLGLVIHQDAPVSVWVHEISHLVDFIFNIVGIDGGYEHTETRAHMAGKLFDQLEDIMAPILEEYLSQEEDDYLLPGEAPIIRPN